MSLRIITLSENIAGQPYLLAEWGLSILVEDNDRGILLDTGASISLIHNAEKMGIDLSKIEKIVLSHGHFDHTGGLLTLLKKIDHEVEIIAHPDIWTPKYHRREKHPDRYIGIPYSRHELENLGARFTLTRDPVEITENISTTGEIPMVTDFEKIDAGMFVKADEEWKPDLFPDDLALSVKSPAGLVIILGCAHRGMINTLYHVRELGGNRKINLVLGGCHLKNATDEQIWQTISALNEMGVQRLGVSHCTGMRATLLLAQIYDKDFIFNHTGNTISFD